MMAITPKSHGRPVPRKTRRIRVRAIGHGRSATGATLRCAPGGRHDPLVDRVTGQAGVDRLTVRLQGARPFPDVVSVPRPAQARNDRAPIATKGIAPTRPIGVANVTIVTEGPVEVGFIEVGPEAIKRDIVNLAVDGYIEFYPVAFARVQVSEWHHCP